MSGYENNTRPGNNTIEMEMEAVTTNQQHVITQQNLLTQILSDPSLKVCYKCGQDFSQEEILDDDDTSNNMLFGGLVLSRKTPASICLSCLTLKMLDSLTERFTKNNKDYQGLFNQYKEKYKV